jgi:hypothetical protein
VWWTGTPDLLVLAKDKTEQLYLASIPSALPYIRKLSEDITRLEYEFGEARVSEEPPTAAKPM